MESHGAASVGIIIPSPVYINHPFDDFNGPNDVVSFPTSTMGSFGGVEYERGMFFLRNIYSTILGDEMGILQ